MSHDPDQTDGDHARRLEILQRLLAIRATELRPVLTEASRLVAEALGADKVDVFLYETASDSLVALGTSDTPMGRRQHAIGLDRIPLARGGRLVEVFRGGEHYLTGHAERDPRMLRGFVADLGVRSCAYVPLDIRGERRGALLVDSARSEAFSERDLHFAEAIADWIGLIAERAELVERLTSEAEERGRRSGAAELARLTPRQREVVALIARGLTDEQIAERLVITRGTVGRHVEKILAKLGFRNRTQIAAWAVRHGLHD